MLSKNKKIAYGLILTGLIVAFLLTSEHAALREMLVAQEVYYRGEYTITTYYPAPYGRYEDLVAMGKLYIGTDTNSIPGSDPLIILQSADRPQMAINDVSDFTGIGIGFDWFEQGEGRGFINKIPSQSTARPSEKNYMQIYADSRDSAIPGGYNPNIDAGIRFGIHRRGSGYGKTSPGEIMRITKEGRIGIGTTDPLGKLHIRDGEWPGNLYDDDGDGLEDETAQELFIIGGSGQVGIGTTDPQASLHIVNSNKNSPGRADIRIEAPSENAYLFLHASGYASNPTALIVKKNTDLGGNPSGLLKIINAADSELNHLVIDNDGKVGIGTTEPKSKLHVTGLPEYTDNVAAKADGLTTGAFYRTGDILKVVHD